MVDGRWKMEDGKWKMENGKWRVHYPLLSALCRELKSKYYKIEKIKRFFIDNGMT